MGRIARIGVCGALVLALCQGAHGRQDAPQGPDETLSGAALVADLDVLVGSLKAIHPGLYRYQSPSQFEERCAALRRRFERGMAIEQVFLELSQFTASIRCGHTFLNPSNQREGVIERVFRARRSLPFAFRWIDGRMVITGGGAGDARLAKGTEVVSINGAPVRLVLERLLPYIRADGSNDAKRISLLEVSGRERWEAFDVFFPLLYPAAEGRYELVVRRAGEQAVETVLVGAVGPEDRRRDLGADADADEQVDEAAWRLEVCDDGIALLRMASWVAYKTKWDWRGHLHGVFDRLCREQHSALVIDLRGNEGGSSVGDEILSRLIERPTARSVRERFVRYVRTPQDLDGALDTWDESFKDWSGDAIGPMDLADRETGLSPGATSGFFRLRNEDGSDPEASPQWIQPRGPRYTGRVFVLIDSSNSSATFEFASRLKSLGLATLVGRPTGGNQRGINGGAFFFVRLEQSGLEVDLPIIAQFGTRGAGLAPDAGVEPDAAVWPTPAEIAAGVDVDMREVRRLLERGR